MADENSKFIVLQSVKEKERFYTTNVPGKDHTKSFKGETWYEVLGYADTSEEAQKILWPTELDKALYLHNYLMKHELKMAAMAGKAGVEYPIKYD